MFETIFVWKDILLVFSIDSTTSFDKLNLYWINSSSVMAECLMLVENGDETFVIKIIWPRSRTAFIVKIHIVCERKLSISRKQLEQWKQHYFLYIFENVCKKLVSHCVGFDTIKLVSLTWVNDGHGFIDILE